MKTIVIFNSQTGFTERYARWIAESAGAECVELISHSYDISDRNYTKPVLEYLRADENKASSL